MECGPVPLSWGRMDEDELGRCTVTKWVLTALTSEDGVAGLGKGCGRGGLPSPREMGSSLGLWAGITMSFR